VTSSNRPEPPLSHLLVDALFGFLATVVMMLAVLVAVGAWAMDWPVVFVSALALALLAHAAHRRGLVDPTVSLPGAIGYSLIELSPLAGGVVTAVSLATGSMLWTAIGVVLIVLGLVGNLLV
jgi:hypothetical protein